jgi:hypothetical protein
MWRSKRRAPASRVVASRSLPARCGLAQRSATAAKEIKSLIGASVERVTSGSRLVDDAGRTTVGHQYHPDV